jgi:outer membrane immunogenic protein
MKKLLLTIALALITGYAFTQNPLPKGAAQFNVGVGLSGWGVPIYLGLDFGVGENVTAGGELSYRAYRHNWDHNRYRHNIIGLSGNVNYHFNNILEIPPQWDFYAGLNLGFYYWSSPTNYGGDNRTGVGLGAQIGGRYYFNKTVGINLEFGGGNAFSGGKFGLTFKL